MTPSFFFFSFFTPRDIISYLDRTDTLKHTLVLANPANMLVGSTYDDTPSVNPVFSIRVFVCKHPRIVPSQLFVKRVKDLGEVEQRDRSSWAGMDQKRLDGCDRDLEKSTEVFCKCVETIPVVMDISREYKHSPVSNC